MKLITSETIEGHMVFKECVHSKKGLRVYSSGDDDTGDDFVKLYIVDEEGSVLFVIDINSSEGVQGSHFVEFYVRALCD